MTSRAPEWSDTELDELFSSMVVFGRDANAGAALLPRRLGTDRGIADRPWDEAVRELPPVDGAEVIRTWWRALSTPGEVHSLDLRRCLDGGWVAEQLVVLNLLHQPEWGVVLVGVERIGPAEPPEVDMDVDGIGARVGGPVWIVQHLDATGVVLHTEGRVEEMFGRPPEELRGRMVLEFLHPEDHLVALEGWTGLLAEPGGMRTIEQRVVRPDGSALWIESSLLNGLDGDGGFVTSVSHDITARRERERSLWRRSQMDELTGVWNRHAIYERLRLAARGAVTVGFVDLDEFKDVNDSLGHAAGDHVLAVVGRRLNDNLPDRAEVGRWGGDEFLVVMTGEHPELAGPVGAALGGVVRAAAGSWTPQASIGVAVGGFGEDPGRLVGRADAAMYAAKRRHRAGAGTDDAALTG